MMRRFGSSMLPALALLLGCSGASAPAAGPQAAPAAAEARKVRPDFARRECKSYRGLKELELACTIRRNAGAGRTWLELVAGRSLEGLKFEERLALAQRALADARQVGESELADLGWLVAEGIRARHGGRYQWDAAAEEVWLRLDAAPQLKLLPMSLIERALRGDEELTRLPARIGLDPRAHVEEPRCEGVTPRDVLPARLAE